MRKLTPIYSMVNFVDDAHFRRVWKHPKKTITPKQRAWVQYMLTVWGRINRGDDSPAGAINVIGRLMIRSQWSPDMGGHIERMVNWLYSDEGGALRGEALYKKLANWLSLSHQPATSSLSPKNQMMPRS